MYKIWALYLDQNCENQEKTVLWRHSVLVCKFYKNKKKIVDISEKFPNTLGFPKMYNNCFGQKNWAGLNILTIPDALLCCINSVFFLNFLTISRFLCLNLLTSSFLIHISMQQLLRQMPTYIEKKHYHVSTSAKSCRYGLCMARRCFISIQWYFRWNISLSLSCRKYR